MASSSAVVSRPANFSSNLRLLLGYGLMIAGMVACYLAIRSYGETLSAPAATAVLRAQAPAGHSGAIGHVLLSLVIIIILARLLGSAFHYFHQPPVIGEIIAGILLGPSLLGQLAPAISAYVFPTSVGPFLGVTSEIGVILYMFLVGLSVACASTRHRLRSTPASSNRAIQINTFGVDPQ